MAAAHPRSLRRAVERRRATDADGGRRRHARGRIERLQRRHVGRLRGFAQPPARPRRQGGDTHTSSVDDLRADYQKEGSPLVGTEFVAPPASSLESLAPQFVEGALRNPWIHLYDITNKGYLRVEATRSQLRGDFRYVTTTQQPQAEPMAGTSWAVESGKPGAQQA